MGWFRLFVYGRLVFDFEVREVVWCGGKSWGFEGSR